MVHISTSKAHVNILKYILVPKVYIFVPFERVLPTWHFVPVFWQEICRPLWSIQMTGLSIFTAFLIGQRSLKRREAETGVEFESLMRSKEHYSFKISHTSAQTHWVKAVKPFKARHLVNKTDSNLKAMPLFTSL